MPFKSNEEVKSKINGAKNYSESQLNAFRSAFNSSYASCMKDGGKTEDCESKAIAIGHSAAKKVKHEKWTAFLESKPGEVTKITVGFYSKPDNVYKGDNLSYEICEETWKTYILDGDRCVAILSGWESMEFDYAKAES